jgi:GNAT superfamily N-acetyltransferase
LRNRLWFDTTLVVLQRSTGGQAIHLTGIAIREVDPAESDVYERDVANEPAATVVRRLASPTSSCWVADEGGRFVHASWIETRAAWVGEADRFFVVPEGGAYIYESFTRPEMRGRGVYPAVLTAISAELAQRGIATLWIAAEATNHSSLRAIAKAGFSPSFQIEVRRRWGRTQVVVPRGAEPRFSERLPGPLAK